MTDPIPLHPALSPVAILRDPATIRDRAHRLRALGLAGGLDHFALDMERLDPVADLVAGVIRENYPTLAIPYHARWRHFTVGGTDRWARLSASLPEKPAIRARAAIDLAVVSVLLDAGAGAAWSYREPATGRTFTRSEGLAVASLDMFAAGLFSSDPKNPLQADAAGLAALDEARLAEGFQVGPNNPMTGLGGRIGLLRRLSGALSDRPALFGGPPARPGHLFDHFAAGNERIPAPALLGALLDGFAPIWPGRIEMEGKNLGDVWRHSRLHSEDATSGLMPIHKLSQWLTYSLLEPFEWAGIQVTALDGLTGLAEYRNGGLFMDTGLLRLKDPEAALRAHAPGDELIVEWRALTVALLDLLRLPVAARLGVSAMDFPLAKLLEGGTWAAGRKLAFARDPKGDPPLKIVSDGTVF
jgi:hypothetical protein